MSNKKYKFSGHETFVFRYGWLEKGVRSVKECPTVFSEDDALVRLGVGKNMVTSIRHWCWLTQLVELDPEIENNTGRHLRPTDLANRLLSPDGWDPFLEDDASLWLLHWLLVTNSSIGTSWQLLFSRFNRPGFTRGELINYIRAFAERESLKVSNSILTRDVDCLLRTYVAGENKKKKYVVEETFNCPFLQLNLIHPSPDGESYRFNIGAKPSLPASIFAFSLWEYLNRGQRNQNTISVQECLYGEGSPGQVFKLDENSLINYIEDMEEAMKGNIGLDETAGLKQIYRRQIFDPRMLLDQYYKGGRQN